MPNLFVSTVNKDKSADSTAGLGPSSEPLPRQMPDALSAGLPEPCRTRGARGSVNIAVALFIALLMVVLLFGRKLGLPSDLVSLYYKLQGIQVKKGDWKPVTPTEGGFTVEMPGEPTVETKSDIIAGAQLPITAYTVHVPERYAFIATAADFRENIRGMDLNAVLDAARDSAVKDEKGRLVSDTPIGLDLVSGRECMIESGGTVLRARFYLKDSNLYSLRVRSTKDFVVSRDAERFFASFAFLGNAALNDPAAAGWMEFSPMNGRFSVQMPGIPASEEQNFNTKAGNMTLYVFNLNRGWTNEKFSVQYTDYPEQLLREAGAADTVLKKASTVDAFNIGGTLVSEKVLSLGRYPGRELQVENAEMAMRIRLYLIDQRLYKLIATWPKSRSFSADDERFLTSFRLTS